MLVSTTGESRDMVKLKVLVQYTKTVVQYQVFSSFVNPFMKCKEHLT